MAQVKASEGHKEGFLDSADSTFEFQVRVAEPGRWSRRVQLAHGTPGPKEATHLGTINEQPARELRSPHTGWDVWRPLDVQVELQPEINTLPFDKREESAEADWIELGTVEVEPSPMSADTAAVPSQERDESLVLLPRSDRGDSKQPTETPPTELRPKTAHWESGTRVPIIKKG